jgi:hypothetical protein
LLTDFTSRWCPKKAPDENQARQLAEELSADLANAGMPLRHAGSFGFDFAATEWFHDTSGDRYLVRIAVPDLPTLLWGETAKAIADWWSRRNRPRERIRTTLISRASG